MTSESNRISAQSIGYIQNVCASWGWSWQEIGQGNDDGLDGYVYLREKVTNESKPSDKRSWRHEFTGGMIHVQVKTGDGYRAKEDESFIHVRIANLETKRSLWEKSPLPCALIYVASVAQGKNPSQAWWCDLRSDRTYQDGKVVIPKINRFQSGLECRKPFSRLALGSYLRAALPTVDLTQSGTLPGKLRLSMNTPIKQGARAFYKEWTTAGALHKRLGKIEINRTGWSHITRPKRPVSRVMASLALLPAAARIIDQTDSCRTLRRVVKCTNHEIGEYSALEFLGLTAMVISPDRSASEVMVILRRKTTYLLDADSQKPKTGSIVQKTWFYTVYEPGRKKKL